MLIDRILNLLLFAALLAVPSVGQLTDWDRAMVQAESSASAGKPVEALQYYEDACRAADAEADEVKKAIALGRRASLLHDLQRVRDAERGYRDAIAILRQKPPDSPDHKYLVPLVISLAALYLELDQPSKAVALGIPSLLAKVEVTQTAAHAHGILGSIAFVRGKSAEAEEFWLRSLQIFEADNSQKEAAVMLSNLGVLAAGEGKMEKAAAYLQRSVETLQATIGLTHPSTVKTQANFGLILQRLGRNQESAQWLVAAHELAKRWYGDENALTVQICIARAGVLRKLGQKQEAAALMKEVRGLPAAAKAALPGSSTVDLLRLNIQPAAVR